METKLLLSLLCVSLLALAQPAQPPDCDTLSMQMIESLITEVIELREAMAERRVNVDTVWKPGRNCVLVWKLCDDMVDHRLFTEMMTGPGGTLGVKSHGASASAYTIDPNDLLYRSDMDFDRDVDLYDFALRDREKEFKP